MTHAALEFARIGRMPLVGKMGQLLWCFDGNTLTVRIKIYGGDRRE